MHLKHNSAVSLKLIMIFIFIIFVPCGVSAQDDLEQSELIEEQIYQGVNLLEEQGIMDYWEQLETEVGDYLPEFSPQNIISWFAGQGDGFSISSIFNGLLRYLWREVLLNLNLMGQLLVLSVIAAVLKNLQAGFDSRSVGQVAEAVEFVILLGMAVASFKVAMDVGGNAINQMVDFMLALIPLLLTLLASLGSMISVTIFDPLLVAMLNISGSLVQTIIFPLIFFAAVLALINHFSEYFNVDRLASFLKDLSVWALGIMLTIFIGFLSIRGVAGTIGDAIGLRTAKFVTGTFIPVVGKLMADAVETVAGVSLVLKNSVGIAGLLILFFIILFPLIKIIVLVFIYRLTAALVQPLGENTIGDCLNTMGDYLLLLFGAVCSVALLFFISVAIIISAGNFTMMLR